MSLQVLAEGFVGRKGWMFGERMDVGLVRCAGLW